MMICCFIKELVVQRLVWKRRTRWVFHNSLIASSKYTLCELTSKATHKNHETEFLYFEKHFVPIFDFCTEIVNWNGEWNGKSSTNYIKIIRIMSSLSVYLTISTAKALRKVFNEALRDVSLQTENSNELESSKVFVM